MRKYEVTEYEFEDYEQQRYDVWHKSMAELANFIEYVARGYLSDYNYTGSESDFYNHYEQMMMAKAVEVLRGLEDGIKTGSKNL